MTVAAFYRFSAASEWREFSAYCKRMLIIVHADRRDWDSVKRMYPEDIEVHAWRYVSAIGEYFDLYSDPNTGSCWLVDTQPIPAIAVDVSDVPLQHDDELKTPEWSTP